MKYISLNKGYRTLVDNEIFDKFNNLTWYINHYGYASHTKWLGSNKTKIIKLHRLVVKCPKGKEIDHINGDKLDNRKENLRIVGRSQNSQNKPVRPDSIYSKFKGVGKQRSRKNGKLLWRARIKSKKIGYFPNEHLAALAYDLWALEKFGKFAKTNFRVIGFG